MKTKTLWYRLSVLFAAAVLLLAQWARAAETDTETVLGRCTERLQAGDNNGHTSLESNFGNFMTDAMRWYSGADAALLPSGDLGNHLQIGDVTEASLANCLQRDMPLAVTSLTAAQLYATLEHSISHYVLQENQTVDWSVSEFDGFLQISGLQVTYNVNAPVGERVLTLATEEGIMLERDDRQTELTVVSTEECLSGGYGYTKAENYTVLGTERQAAAAYVSHLGTVSIPEDSGRITIGGVRAAFLTNPRMAGGLIAVVGLLLVCTSMKFRKRIRR